MTRVLAGLVLIVAMAFGVAEAADPYPTRPVSMVVAFPPGGLADNTARPVAAALERLLKQPVVVVNKAGAAGAVGYQTAASSKPDGYTLLMALVSVSVLPEVDKLFGRPQNYTRDQFTGIARINADPSMLVVRADTPWKTAEGLRGRCEEAARARSSSAPPASTAPRTSRWRCSCSPRASSCATCRRRGAGR